MLQKHLESAKQLNTAEGLFDEEIKICELEIQAIQTAKTERFRENVSQNSDTINFKLFQFERVLNQAPEHKSISLLGKLRGDPTDAKCIANLSKTEFQLAHVEQLGNGKGNKAGDQFEEYFHNDIYRKYWLKFGGAQGDVNKIQCNLMYPASEFLINKYSRQEQYTVRETAEIYAKVTKPMFLDHEDPKKCEWMHNILENKKE